MKDKLIGKYVIVRADKPGVFFGKLIHRDGQEVLMQNARKIFRWEGAGSVEQIACDGVSAEGSKITCEIEQMLIFGADQILPCAAASIANLKAQKPWKI